MPGPAPEPLIQLKAIHKSYQRDSQIIPVLQGLSFHIYPGEFVALMGPSGSGKSTLLNLLAGIDKPTTGEIVIGGEAITHYDETELARWRSHHVGFIFQLYNLIPVLTALENVELPLLLTSLSKPEREAHAKAALRVVGLSDRMDHYPRQLSGGQEQRVGIARALVVDPTFLLADEPTGDLDAVSAEEVLSLLQALNRDHGKTIVMVTHDPRAAEHAQKTIHLDKGVLRA